METYRILRKTPTSKWTVIRSRMSAESARDFLEQIANHECGAYSPASMMASYMEGGDLIRYRADPEG